MTLTLLCSLPLWFRCSSNDISLLETIQCHPHIQFNRQSCSKWCDMLPLLSTSTLASVNKAISSDKLAMCYWYWYWNFKMLLLLLICICRHDKVISHSIAISFPVILQFRPTFIEITYQILQFFKKSPDHTSFIYLAFNWINIQLSYSYTTFKHSKLSSNYAT